MERGGGVVIGIISFLLLLFCCCSRGDDLNTDAQALLAFRQGLSLARVEWNLSTTNTPCSWVGVTCNSNQDRVWAVRLPASGLYGQIAPSTLGRLSQLRILSLRSNKLFGPIPSDLFSGCPELRSLFLQDNAFSGPLPAFNNTLQLNRINLSSNNITGPIPVSINNLSRLATLLLQNNSLSGPLPDPFSFPKLAQFNVSYNLLNGSIPLPLQTFPAEVFSGNSFCGAPLLLACTVAPSSSPSPFNPPLSPFSTNSPAASSLHKLSMGQIIAIAVGAAALLSLTSVCLLIWCLRKQRPKSTPEEKTEKEATAAAGAATTSKSSEKKAGGDDSKEEFSSAQEPQRSKLVFFEGTKLSFDLEDLLRASAEVLGKGSVGTSYKAVLEDGSAVVVKRLRDVATGRKEFEQVMELVGRMQHKSLVEYRAYFFSKDEKLLLQDYMGMGSLSALLHGSKASGRSPLDWDSRVKIALDAARAIAYLHENGGNKFAHGNIKSSNVLLSSDLHARVSDFGIAPLFGLAASAATRAAGYRAPEVTEAKKATQASDVYSFGVLLLELLTGKAPSPTSAEAGGMDLPRWVQSVVREEWTAEVFDVELMRFQNVEEEEMVQLLQVAMACVATMPTQRPPMTHVVKILEDLRQIETDDGTHQSSSDNNNKSKEASATHTPTHD